jgi:hypothetical protein
MLWLSLGIFMKSKVKDSILDKIEIASPCSVSWENMEGDARIRRCDHCQLSVYNISEMSKGEAEKLIQDHEGQLCVRLYRRFDGKVIINDCPVGLRKLRQIMKVTVRTAATLLSFFISLSTVQANDGRALNCPPMMGRIRPVKPTVIDKSEKKPANEKK